MRNSILYEYIQRLRSGIELYVILIYLFGCMFLSVFRDAKLTKVMITYIEKVFIYPKLFAWLLYDTIV